MSEGSHGMPSSKQIPNTSIESFFDDAGTMSLFGGLNMRVTRKASAESSASTPAAAPGAAGGRASASSSTATAANGVGAGVSSTSSSSSSTGLPGAASAASSGFGFLNAAPAAAAAPADVEASAPAAAPGAQPNGNETGFSFLGAQPTTADEGDLAQHRDAAGDALSIGEASTTAVAPSVASSFSFLHADPEATTPPSSSASVPSVEGGADQSASALAASMAAAADEDLLAPAAFIRPANIKKKRGSRRPGFARQGSEAASETSSLAPSVRDGGEGEGDAVEHDHDVDDNNDDGDVEVEEVEEGTNQDLSRQPSRGLHDDEKGQEETVASKPLPKVGGFSFISQSTPDAAPSETPEISSHKSSTKPVNPEPTSTRSRASTSTSTADAASTDSKAEMKGSSDDSDLGELGDLLRAFRRGADQFTKGLARVNERTAKTLEDLDRNAEQSQGLAERVKSLEQEQNEALAAEDFEKADSLQRTMDAVSRSVDEVDSRKLYLNRTLNELRAEKAKVFADQVQSIDIISELLGDCCKKESEKAKTLAADTAAAAEREAAQLDEQEDLLRIDREGIESDLEVAQRELDQINARVDAGTVDLREQRSGWEEKIAVVDEEIEELERQLETKRQERASLSTSLEEVNNGIQAVRSRYETRLNELDERHANVMSKQEVAESRARAIEEARQALEDRRTSTEAKVASLERSAGEIEAQLTILGKIAGRLRKSHAEESGAESGAGKEDDNEDEAAAAAAKMRKMEDEVHVARQNIDFNARKAQEIESQLVELGQRLFDIESKLPALNEQKRLAVSSRNFKEAGRLNGVIKDISGEKGDVEAETTEAREKLAEIRKQMDGKAAHVEELVAAIKDMQDGVNRAMLASLNNKRLALRKTQAEVRASGSVEPNTFGETVLSILRAEASACEEEAKVVSVKICGDDSLAELPPEVEEKMEDEGEEDAEEGADQDTGRASGDGSGKEDAQAQHGNSGVNGDHDGDAEADLVSDDGENNDDDDDVALRGVPADGQEGVDERLAATGATAAEEHDEEGDQEEEEEEEEEEADDGMTIEELEEAINNLESDIADAVEAEDFETAAVLEEEASPLRERLERAKGAQA